MTLRVALSFLVVVNMANRQFHPNRSIIACPRLARKGPWAASPPCPGGVHWSSAAPTWQFLRTQTEEGDSLCTPPRHPECVLTAFQVPVSTRDTAVNETDPVPALPASSVQSQRRGDNLGQGAYTESSHGGPGKRDLRKQENYLPERDERIRAAFN